jgi:hypothetical protein
MSGDRRLLGYHDHRCEPLASRTKLRLWFAQFEAGQPDREPETKASKLRRLARRAVADFRKRMREPSDRVRMFSRPSVQLELKLPVVAPARLSAVLDRDYSPFLAHKDAVEIAVEQLAVGRGHF